jgi:peptidyl-prolyl cis-trans isomerase A (cyclophilin A)
MTDRLAIAYVPVLGIAAVAAMAAVNGIASRPAPPPAPTPAPTLGLTARCVAPPHVATPVVRPPVPSDLAPALERLPLPNIKYDVAFPRANIVTNKGTLRCALFPDVAPRAVANFIGLASGSKPWLDPSTGAVATRPFYNGLTFHRVIPGFVIQGGDPLGNGTGGPGYQFPNEISGIKFQPGALAMANAGPDTNGSQFFITVGETPWLEGHHTIFGQCDPQIAEAIAKVPTGEADRPREPVIIERIELTR